MFKRTKPQLEITDHPEVIAALNAMWQQAYDTGRRDAVAIVQDFREERDIDELMGSTVAIELIERLKPDA